MAKITFMGQSGYLVGEFEKLLETPGTLVIRAHGYFAEGDPMPECDALLEPAEGESLDEAADAAVHWLAQDQEGNAERGKGYIFRVDSDDQSTTLYRLTHESWSRVGV